MEFYVNAVRIPPQHAKKRGEIRDLLAWNPVTADATTLERGWKLQDRYGLSPRNRPIVAATKAASCSYVLTEDLLAKVSKRNRSGESVSPHACGCAVENSNL